MEVYESFYGGNRYEAKIFKISSLKKDISSINNYYIIYSNDQSKQLKVPSDYIKIPSFRMDGKRYINLKEMVLETKDYQLYGVLIGNYNNLELKIFYLISKNKNIDNLDNYILFKVDNKGNGIKENYDELNNLLLKTIGFYYLLPKSYRPIFGILTYKNNYIDSEIINEKEFYPTAIIFPKRNNNVKSYVEKIINIT
ncbi:hypothetical protein YN1_8000 [Nanoarchaeota archaeon]